MEMALKNPSANCFRKFKGLQLTFQVVKVRDYRDILISTSEIKVHKGAFGAQWVTLLEIEGGCYERHRVPEANGR
jgi:hypothetical protein